jgi:ribosomal protein L11 methyltransferase
VSWIALRITPASNREGVIAALFDAGSQGVQEDGTAVVTHFPPHTEIDDVRASVMTADPRADIAISDAPEVDYSEWRAAVTVHRVGALVVAPPWLADGLDPRTTIIIDPVMAFGTGEHPTTRGVLRLVQGTPLSDRDEEKELAPVIRAGDVIADLGAGSAVLSIAAAKLGASRVAAIEIDHDSISNAEQNVRTNGVADRVEVLEGDAETLLPLLAPVRVILANIISSVLLQLLPLIRSALTRDGQAILSGILFDEREEMITALNASGWKIENEDREDAWWSVLIAPR